MTAKEKAIDLFNEYYSYLKANLMYDEEAKEDAKQCALIAVDEIIKELKETEFNYGVENLPFKYWQEVKQEIENI
jgi:hypothetical protein